MTRLKKIYVTQGVSSLRKHALKAFKGVIIAASIMSLQSCCVVDSRPSLDNGDKLNHSTEKKLGQGISYHKLLFHDIMDVEKAKKSTGIDIGYNGEVMLIWDYSRRLAWAMPLTALNERVRLEIASFGFDGETGEIIECKVHFIIMDKMHDGNFRKVYQSSFMDLFAPKKY